MSHGRVAVAMSGGVDSSTVAALLLEQGYEVVGFSMQLWDQTRREGGNGAERTRGCCALEDLYDARRVAARLGIPHYVVNFQKDFEEVVVRSFVEDYRRGLTPSPCVLCNSRMKFDQLMRLARSIGADRVATGHYARVSRDPLSGRILLRKGLDSGKDQSYFLFELNQDQLARAMFPLGGLEKPEVRRAALRFGLEVADKPDSQEICFVRDGDYAGLVERFLNADGLGEELRGGDIVDTDGRVIGTHRGIHHFTIGQRRGLGIARGRPQYVIALDPAAKRVTIGDREQLTTPSVCVQRTNWVSIPEPARPLRAGVKIRSRHQEALATITPSGGGTYRVDFDSPQAAVTPGQAAVFYAGDRVLGGGWIAHPRDLP